MLSASDHRVSIQPCATYERGQVLAALRACLGPWGGMGAFVRAGQRVLVKPNLLMGITPAAAATTHPAVVDAVLTLVREVGGEPMVGDSPGIGVLEQVIGPTGVREVIEEHGAEVADFTREQVFVCEDNLIGKRIALARALAQADVYITVPKLKTHVQLVLTCAIKNQYGLIPGARKGEYHMRLRDRDTLAELLIDINRIAKPALGIVDAIEAMEGDGPSGGTPRHVGLLLAGADMTALDVVASELIGLDPAHVPTIQAARRRGYGATSRAVIQVIGPCLEEVRPASFRHVGHLKDIQSIVPVPKFLLGWIRRHWAPRPRIVAEACIRCFACRNGCPVRPPAIDPARPVRQQVDDRTCIRCYCCHEFCPAHAIVLKRTWLARVISFTRVLDWVARHLGRVVQLVVRLRGPAHV
ncbi:MAG: DUF362 domain-containing protein [bacterium]|nr:DUF362 domain-containing protein [bacterium]